MGQRPCQIDPTSRPAAHARRHGAASALALGRNVDLSGAVRGAWLFGGLGLSRPGESPAPQNATRERFEEALEAYDLPSRLRSLQLGGRRCVLNCSWAALRLSTATSGAVFAVLRPAVEPHPEDELSTRAAHSTAGEASLQDHHPKELGRRPAAAIGEALRLMRLSKDLEIEDRSLENHVEPIRGSFKGLRELPLGRHNGCQRHWRCFGAVWLRSCLVAAGFLRASQAVHEANDLPRGRLWPGAARRRAFKRRQRHV